MIFEVFQRRNKLGLKRWYWRLKAKNGKIIAQSEAYNQRQSAWDTCVAIRVGVSEATIIRELF